MPILGSVPITGFVAPTSEVDVYASHKARYGHGGHRSVQSVAERDAIPDARREEGMTVWDTSTSTEYRLIGGIANANWVVVTGTTNPVPTVVSYTSGEDILPYRVCVVLAGELFYADHTEPSHSQLTKYMSISNGLVGTAISVIEEGLVVSPSLSLVANTAYFLGAQGQLTATPVTTGFLQRVCVAETPTSLYFDTGTAIKL